MATRKLIEYSDPSGTVYEGVAFSTSSDSAKPLVVIFPAFRGITHFEESQAEKLANLGYIAFCADIYGKGVRPTTFPDARATMTPLVSNRTVALKERLFASLETAKKLPGVDVSKVAATGYCLGGLCALDLARFNSGILAAVSYHGTLTPLPDTPLEHITATIQVHHGDADSHINTQVEGFYKEFRERKADFTFTAYADAKHSFTEPEADSFNSPGVGYNKKAAERSWAATIALFKEIF